MANAKLYVGNLSYSATKEEIAELFAGFGEVTDVHVLEGKGFGFVQMSTEEAANDALAQLNGTVFKGRALRIDVARPREERPRREYGGGQGGGERRYGGGGYGGDRGSYDRGGPGGGRGSYRGNYDGNN